MDVYLTLEARLEPRARVVHSTLFESALVKIKDQKKGEINISEKRAVRPLLISTVSTPQQEKLKYSIIERALNRLRAEISQNHTPYLDTRLLLPNYNLCGRLFSISGYVWTNRRRGIP